jgi:transcriptional regulator with XRE-family HTH domain
METLGTTLRVLRENARYSQRKASAAIGVTFSYLSKAENGHTVPGRETLARLAALYDGNLDDLLRLAGKYPPEYLPLLQRVEALEAKVCQLEKTS